MANLATLKPNPFKNGADSRRNLNGRPVGTRNRSTILKEILALEHKFDNPITNKSEKMEVEKAIDFALVKNALGGDVQSIREVKDTIYGKVADKVESVVETLSDSNLA